MARHLQKTVKKLHKEGFDIKSISNLTETPEDEVKAIIDHSKKDKED